MLESCHSINLLEGTLSRADLSHYGDIKSALWYYCMSSCFNYLMLASSEIQVLPEAILGFHGSAESTAKSFPIAVGARILQFMMRDAIKREREFLSKVGKPEGLFIELNEIRLAFTDEEKYDDVNFWMVGKSYFEEHGIALSANSYFPTDQEELNRQVTRIIGEIDEDVTLVMTSDFGQ